MPSLTRLAAAVLFAIAALYLGEQYKGLYDDPPRMGGLVFLLAPTFGFAGWKFTGGRISGRLISDIFEVLQGFLFGLFLALAVFGTLEVFQMGYKVRYKTLYDAMIGFFDLTGTHLLRMLDQDFLILAGICIVSIGIFLSILYRWAERSRLAK